MQFDFDMAWKVFTFLFSVTAMVIAYMRTRNREVEARMDGYEVRLQRLESHAEGAPTKDDVHDLTVAVTKLTGEISVLREKVDGQGAIMTRIEATVGRHDEHLMDRS
ncbi:MAG: DUF2730 family protein [Pseudomonadota bacterium]